MELEPMKLEVVGMQSIEVISDKGSQYLIIAQVGDGTMRNSPEALTRMAGILEKIVQEIMPGTKVKVFVTDTPLTLDFYRLKPGE